MVTFNYQAKEVSIKIVYYGPGLCGKTTTLQYIYSTLPDETKGKMLSLATQTDRTLFFDFLPIQLGKIKGLDTKIQLYTVPGQVFYNQTRKLVLKGVDGIVFVADSQTGMLDANKESFDNMLSNLDSLGLKLEDIPHVMQYNKRDLPNLLDVETLNRELNIYNVPYFETSAITGDGIVETLKEIIRLTLVNITEKYNVEIEYMVEEEDEVADERIDESIDTQEISPADLEDMDTDINFSVDLDDRVIGEDYEDSNVESLDEADEYLGESIEELEDKNVEEMESIEEVDEILDEEGIETETENVEGTTEIQEDQLETQKIDSKVLEEQVETADLEVEEIEVEAPRVVKANNGFFVPITIVLPEGMDKDVRLNIDLRLEIKRKKR